MYIILIMAIVGVIISIALVVAEVVIYKIRKRDAVVDKNGVPLDEYKLKLSFWRDTPALTVATLGFGVVTVILMLIWPDYGWLWVFQAAFVVVSFISVRYNAGKIQKEREPVYAHMDQAWRGYNARRAKLSGYRR